MELTLTLEPVFQEPSQCHQRPIIEIRALQRLCAKMEFAVCSPPISECKCSVWHGDLCIFLLLNTKSKDLLTVRSFRNLFYSSAMLGEHLRAKLGPRKDERRNL
jgi:hypothetical protein